MEIKSATYSIFKKGSKTFSGSSLFFPREIRDKVSVLYAFVRKVDDCVDTIPQDKKGFYNYWSALKTARGGKKTNSQIVNEFVLLEKTERFDPKWVDAFMESMESDLKNKKYKIIKDTEKYIYGSAAVIGLCMARLMGLSGKSYPFAQALGRSFQLANFIRDISEDLSLHRMYFPQNELAKFHLAKLTKEEAIEKSEDFAQFMAYQIKRYRLWQAEAEKGFRLIPRRYLIPIKTASDLYKWTIDIIEKNPFIVYEKKIKPGKLRIFLAGIKNTIFS